MEDPILPNQFPHIFVDVAFDLIPEIDYDELVFLSNIVKTKHREDVYLPFVDALRKIQWAKLSAVDAINVDIVLSKEYEQDTIIQDPVGQIRHAKSILDFVSQSKASLDSIAVFLNDILSMGFNRGQRDFRHNTFKNKLSLVDSIIGSFIKTESKWMDIGVQTSESIITVRDEWLHRGSPNICLIWPPTDLGALPIPKLFTIQNPEGINITRDNYYSTQEFCNYHLTKLIKLFTLISKRTIEIESLTLSTPIIRPNRAKNKISAVKVYLTKAINLKEMKIGPFTRSSSTDSK